MRTIRCIRLRNGLQISSFWSIAGLLAALLFTACGGSPLEVRLKPGSEQCMESRITMSGDFSKVEEGITERPINLELLQEFMRNENNLAAALARKKYVIHYYQRLADWDEEIVPAKFPLFWEIDSTAMQTEGTYLLRFKSKDNLAVSFACEECQQINPKGERSPAKRSNYSTEFNAGTQSVQKNEDWTFKLRPRKIQLAEEVGKQYLVKIESRESYIAAAKDRLELEPDGEAYRLRFRDPFAYRAENFTKALAIAMVNEDQLARRNAIDKVLEAVDAKIATMQTSMDSLTVLSVRDGKSRKIHAEMAALEKEMAKEKDRKAYWEVQRGAFIPRFIVINNAYPCGTTLNKK